MALGVSANANAQLADDTNVASGSIPTVSGMAPILYEQTDNASGNGAPDQDFEAAFDVYDSMGADDFIVTNGAGWVVTGVDTVGTQSTGGTAASVTIEFYDDNAGSPGNVVCSYPGLTPTQNAGSFTIQLPAPCNLNGGETYWMAQQTVQDFGGNGQHFWSNRTTQTGNPAHWINPGDGFGSGCTTFTPMTTCGVGGGTNPDFLFVIRGFNGGSNQIIPTMGGVGLGILGLTMVGGGLMAMRRRRKS